MGNNPNTMRSVDTFDENLGLDIEYRREGGVALALMTVLTIRDFAFQWDSDIKDLCTQNKQAKSGIPREKLSLVLEKMCVHECL